ncbi:MAG: hypothetical protein QOK90_11640 [Nitrososphaeraceae archaeon]|nr:hypothetical protein [Nitrososphaeraceae archaeon]
MSIEKQYQQKTTKTTKHKLKVVQTFAVVSLIVLFGVSPINKEIGISGFFVTDIMVKEDNSKIEIQQQYCFNQQSKKDSFFSIIPVVAYAAKTKIDIINPICYYSNPTIMSKNIISLYSLPSSGSSSPFSSSSKNKKLVHSSIRMEENVFNLLQKEAERQGISFNSLINKTLKNYVKSEMHFEQLGFLLVSKDFLRKTFAELQDEKRLEELGKELGLTVAKEYVSYCFPKVDSCTLIQFLDIWFRRLQSYKHIVDTSRVKDINVIIEEGIRKENEEEYQQLQRKEIHYFTVNHDININFSIALKAGLEGLIEPIIKSPIIFKQITSNSISFSFSLFLSS